MVVAKTEMSSIPGDCWSCDLIHDELNGYTVCSILRESLYPMGSNRVLENCPLVEMEVEDVKR